MVNEFQHNEWALILGGSSGLGLATAKKLAQEGLNIFIVHRDPRSQMTLNESAFEEIKQFGVQLLSLNKDALRPETIENTLDQLAEKGLVKVLVHSIAKGNLKPMIAAEESTLQSDDFLLTTNAMAVSFYTWTKGIHDRKLFAENAKVLAFTSEGSVKAWRHYAAVSAAKSALEAIMRNIALEFAPFGITANCIQAGVTDTESLRRIPGSDSLKEFAIKRNPFGRLTTPEDVANAVYLLCKKEAQWINGTILKVDGGESIN
ncbi:MAG: short-chain dehydrogenase [Flavobacteriaceae bacterium]|nr:short-chain dehydrogenase [Flavobacteriaceae bacterium]|tara:strand:+ start:368673 stop:369455 length:783 start_codon:yes stop_codon:yes gene_type:complete